jgi:two-component system, cell cycle response regulator
MNKLGFGDNPTWFAILLFVRNLVDKFSIFSNAQKAKIQKYIVSELATNDRSQEHLQQVITQLEELITQSTAYIELKRQCDLLKESSNSFEQYINKFIKEFLDSEQEKQKLVQKFGDETITMLDSGESTGTMFPKLKLLVADMLLHYRTEAQAWEKKARLLEQTVNVDPLLAPLHNRRALEEHLQKAVHRSSEQHTPLSVLMIDIDNFKGVNDAYTHQIGDDVLKTLAKIINAQASKHNWFVARYGGDELVMVCELTAEEALFQADAIRMAVQNYEFHPRIGDKLEDDIIRFTISIGVAEYQPGISSDELLNAADKAMYQVKGTGKNNVAQYCNIDAE